MVMKATAGELGDPRLSPETKQSGTYSVKVFLSLSVGSALTQSRGTGVTVHTKKSFFSSQDSSQSFFK